VPGAPDARRSAFAVAPRAPLDNLQQEVRSFMSTTIEEFHNYINGEWVRSRSGRTFDDINPADTREIVGRFQASTKEDAADAVAAAAAAFPGWRATPIGKRAKILTAAAEYLEAHADQFAKELTREEGKALGQARDEFLRSAQTFRFYAVEGQSFTGESYPNDDPGQLVYSLREPLGVVTAITPWNFPASIPARKIAPALITGNTVVFKPSSDAPLSGLRLVEALAQAGLPKGVINFITGKAGEVGPTITESPAIRAVTFTGSTGAGEHIHRSVAMTTRTQMELGGKNPLIVMEDADLDRAVELTIKGGLSLTGQACTGTSRVLVHRDVKEAFTTRLVAKVKALKIGNGLMSGMDLGPLATAAQLDTVLSYIDIGKREATLLCGGERLTGDGYDHGYYVSPAIFDDVTQDMRIAREEIFGPVICLIETSGYADALAKANDTEYGLAAAICTQNPRYIHDFTHDIEAGTVKVNRTTTGNLINAPFGGLKRSSTSTFRESGRAGLEFYTQIKTVYRGW
jgi:aldehyde dehydrogenase (NAD+)